MEEVFYFTPNKVSLQELSHYLSKKGFRYEMIEGSETYFRLSDNTDAYAKWYDVTTDKTMVWDENLLSIMTDKKTQTVIMISFRVYSFPLVKKTLKLVIQKYGGWAGCDDDWEQLYTDRNVDKMHCFDRFISQEKTSLIPENEEIAKTKNPFINAYRWITQRVTKKS